METLAVVLERLKRGGEVSGESMASELGLSRTAIWKAVDTLRRMGYGIEGTHSGYILKTVPDLLLPTEIAPLLRGGVFGSELHHRIEVDSTNRIARELAEGGSPEGTVVVAEEQKGGRGRMGRTWASPRGGVWFSVVLRPGWPPSKAPLLTLAAANAVAGALRALAPRVDATIKWPNDVLVRGRKVCGILSEVSGEMDVIDFAVIGVGLNANFKLSDLPGALAESAATLLEITGNPVNRPELLAAVMGRFEETYALGPDAIIEAWKAMTSTLGRRVRVLRSDEAAPLEGLAVGVSPEGALVVKTDDGEEQIVYSGDCVHLEG